MANNTARKLIEFCSENKCPNHRNCDLCMYETGVKEFAKFLIDKGIGEFEMPDLVKEFLEE